MKRIALNGFGRIGKNFLRVYLNDPHAHNAYQLVAINIGPADLEALAYMITYDSLLGRFTRPVLVRDGFLLIDHHTIRILQETDALRLPWADLKIDSVVDATGAYTRAEKAREHITSGAGNVIITAPAQGEDCTIVMGVNQQQYRPEKDRIISLGSCTTNARVPLLHVIKMHAPILHSLASTVHAYTNTQELLDVDAHSKDLRKSRAAALNIIPSSTGAAVSVAAVMPEFKHALAASALRVPVPVVSLADVTVLLEKPVTAETVNSWFTSAAESNLKNILSVSGVPLVSTDFQGNSHSVIVDATMTVVSGTLLRVYGWYDNEWGYSCRIHDFLRR